MAIEILGRQGLDKLGVTLGYNKALVDIPLGVLIGSISA